MVRGNFQRLASYFTRSSMTGSSDKTPEKQGDDNDENRPCSKTSRSSPIQTTSGLGSFFSKVSSGLNLSGKTIDIDGETFEMTQIKTLIPELRRDNVNKTHQIRSHEKEINSMKKLLKDKDTDIKHLKEEVDKLHSVLRQTRPLNSVMNGISNLGSPSKMTVMFPKMKKQGVSGESTDFYAIQGNVKRSPKDIRSKQLIKTAIESNEFTRYLQPAQIKEIIDCMHERVYNVDDVVLSEGEPGDHLYVINEGILEVTKDNRYITRLSSGTVFGELAILYNCTRTATVKAITFSRLWLIERNVFQFIMKSTVETEENEILRFLKSVPLFKELSQFMLQKLVYSVETTHYDNDCIIREGSVGDTFFIIRKGRVQVVKNKTEHSQGAFLRYLDQGDYFGEKALLSQDRRTASVIAVGAVECVIIDRLLFQELIGPLKEIKTKEYHHEGVIEKSLSEQHSDTRSQEDEYSNIKLEHLEIVATLGIGGFGRVELVKLTTDDSSTTFALKCLKKRTIVELRQIEHVFSEKRILMECRSPFITRLYTTFKDKRFLYMLMEVCLGGELWIILRERGSFDTTTTRFISASVIEAFHYLHARGIVYRDLKPENLLLNNRGYIKMCDFGFAKKIGFHTKTWTFCGTPDYVPPEIILNKGHDFAADFWSLGILIFELLTGMPPFCGNDPMKTYSLILKGMEKVDFPAKINKSSSNIIQKLCKLNPSERLGYQRGGILDIKMHKWFESFDWDGLERNSLESPINVRVNGPMDFTNFDTHHPPLEQPPEDTSGWDEEF